MQLEILKMQIIFSNLSCVDLLSIKTITYFTEFYCFISFKP